MFRDALKAAGIRPTDLAARLGMSPPAISHWLKHGRIPAERVLAVEAATGIPRFKLRPDLYPPREDAA